MKKLSIVLLILMVMMAAFANGAKEQATPSKSISLWTYPIGGWGDDAKVKALTDAFTAETGIKVEVQYLTYADGDDKVNTAIAAKQAPDLIMEGPERLVANWGAKGYLVDMADLLDAGDRAELNQATLKACLTADGKLYEYPLVMTAHCMAINLDAFKAAGADKYVNLTTRTWTTDDFIKAVDALYKYYKAPVGAVFCGGQGGDQGTRVLVNSLYGGTFTDAAHTKYTWDSPENVKALKQLYEMPGIVYDPAIAGGDEINLFRNGTFKMAFCWNIAQQPLNDQKTDAGEQIVFMSFPAQNGVAQLNGGIWGFGIFDNGDAEKIEWAKQFVKFMCDGPKTADAVKTANYFAVRDVAGGQDISKIWADDATMNEYNVLMQYLGDYYQVTTGWATARTCWWNMLQAVGAGNDIAASVAKFAADANAAAAAGK
ncbi:MAG: extracellular solute-binding protein [Sphaerochaetaceae bacterium]|nr:extracellular solute-binding protein [Sphaerochaetaceae bacterium]